MEYTNYLTIARSASEHVVNGPAEAKVAVIQDAPLTTKYVMHRPEVTEFVVTKNAT